MDMQIGVVGCGLMGRGIIHSLALYGFNVIIVKHKEEDHSFLNYLKYELKKGRLKQTEYDYILKNVHDTTELTEVSKCQLVIESIHENLKAKQTLFQKLDKICMPETIFASNTSGIPIHQLAEVTNRPDKVIGMHFMSPVPVMELVEVINGIHTSEQTYQFTKSIVETIEKTPVAVKDTPGFVTSRLAASFVNEAIRMIEEQVADAESIDLIAKLGLGFPIGPLRLADAIGLDVTLNVLENMQSNFNDKRYAASPLLYKMVADGKFGKKSGAGFYLYKK